MFDSIVDAIIHHGKHIGEKPAIIIDDAVITYGELSRRIPYLAAQLSEQGIKYGDKIVLSADHTIQFIELYFAIHWLGAVNVPVEKKAAVKSQSQLIRTLSPQLVILQNAESGAESYQTYTGAAYAVPKNRYPSDSLADILFTTGTTGTPKGVMLSHHNETAGALNVINGGEMTADDINLLTMPLHHAFGLTTLRAVLYQGGTAVLQDGVVSLKKMDENIRLHHCNAVYMVPAALRVLYFHTRQRLDLLLGTVEKIEFCTAPLDRKMRSVLSEQLDGVRLYNSYGATESARSVYMRLDKNQDKPDAIGQAVKNVTIKITDDSHREIASSRQNIGHLAISGDMNMLGYYNETELTERILSNGVFYSEDLGYMDRDGFIYLSGRKNDVINIGGEKVSPLEIENTALAFPGIRECACIGVSDTNGVLENKPVLYIAEEMGYHVDIDGLKKYLKNYLEAFKVPDEIMMIDDIPKNQIGKIDRGILNRLWNSRKMEG